MEKILDDILQTLQKLVGLHRQLLETIRIEREALTQADLQAIQTVTSSKQTTIQEIHHTESLRLKQIAELVIHLKVPFRELTLQNIAIRIQISDPKRAEQLRGFFNVLTLLIQRATEQNQFNNALVEKSIEHIYQLKKNALGEANASSMSYSKQGQKVNSSSSSSSSSRLISKEV